MLRVLLCSVALLGFCVAVTAADDKDTKKDAKTTKNAKDKKGVEAKVVKVDKQKGTVTLKMRKKDGKEEERTFTLTEDVRYMDSKGNVASLDVFQSGNLVLVVEREGKISQLKKRENKGKEGSKAKDSTNKEGKSATTPDKK